MTVLDEITESACDHRSQTGMKLRMLDQMAEALEDQVAALYRRAASFEEEEFLLSRDVEERQTEIHRLVLKLEAMRADRDRVLERIELISGEAAAIREEVFSGEDEAALAAIAGSTARGRLTGLECVDVQAAESGVESAGNATFFRGLAIVEDARQA